MISWVLNVCVIGLVFLFINKSIVAINVIHREGLNIAYKIAFESFCYTDHGRSRMYVSKPFRDCVIECSLRGDCLLMQYKSRIQLCELYTSVNETVQHGMCAVVKRSDLVITQSLCEEECAEGMSCDLETMQCVYKECQGHPSVEYGEILGNRKEVGSKLRLKCIDGFALKSGNNSTVCQTNGSWSFLPKACIQIYWDFQCPVSDMTYTNVSLSPGTLFTYRVVHEIQLDHAQAFQFCLDEGANLVHTFLNSTKNIFLSLMRECQGYQMKNYWIDGNNTGAHDFSSLSEWVTSTGEPLTTNFWFPGQPNKPYTDHCAYLNTENPIYNGLMCDMNCDINFNFICEKNNE